MDAKELESNLQYFSGSERLYRHPFGIVYTDGVNYLADKAGAYWLIDTIASYQYTGAKCWKEPFQVWTLHVAAKVENPTPNHIAAILICDDGNGIELARQNIQYTDFPLEKIKLYLEDGTLMLPQER